MPSWTTPKTNWEGTDYFTASDWLRIVGNLEYIADELSIAYTPYTTVAKGTVLTADDRNVITDLLNDIYASLYASWNHGFVLPRVNYGSAWNSQDLNNIESTIENIQKHIDGTLDDTVSYYSGDEIYTAWGSYTSVGLL